VPLQAAVAALARILSEDQPRKALKKSLSCLPHFHFRGPEIHVRSYFPAEQSLPGRQIGIGSPASAFVPAEQGLPGKQIGIGSPDSAGQLTPGTQGGMGLVDRAAAPNAVPNTTNKNPSIFAFMCLSSAAVAAMGTDSKRRSAPQGPQKSHPVCHNRRPIWETPGNNSYFQKMRSQDCGKPLFSRGKPFFNLVRIEVKLLKRLENVLYPRGADEGGAS